MRYVTSMLTACALAGAVSVLAQEQAPAQPAKEQAPKSTLTGCVVQVKTTDGGTAYMLSKVEGGIRGDVHVSVDQRRPTGLRT